MSVQAEAVNKTTDKTEEVAEAYINENKWAVCHILFSFQLHHIWRTDR